MLIFGWTYPLIEIVMEMAQRGSCGFHFSFEIMSSELNLNIWLVPIFKHTTVLSVTSAHLCNNAFIM